MNLPTIAELAQRAKDVGVSNQALCLRARVPTSTFSRWLNGVTSPPIPAFERVVRAVEEAEAAAREAAE